VAVLVARDFREDREVGFVETLGDALAYALDLG
jgi:hypothetical protein